MQVITQLYDKLYYESRYLVEYDSVKHNFKSYLKKYLTKQPATPFIQKMLADSFIFQVPQATRKHYEYLLDTRMHWTEEEQQEFARLWKLMLLRP